MTDYAKRRIDVTFKLGGERGSQRAPDAPRVFAVNGKDEVKLTGLRCRVTAAMVGEGVQASLNLSVWGMTLSTMNELSTLRVLPGEIRNNTVTVEAGDEAAGMSVVYRGSIIHGWANMNAQPNVSFEVVALTGQFDDLAPANATSYSGGVDVATMVKGLCERMGRGFVNHGVTAQLADPYHSGSLLAQLRAICQAASVEWVDEGDVIHIYPRHGSRRTPQPPIVSPETGMLGFPSYTSGGLDLTTRFNPEIKHGGLIEVKSSLTPACGRWAVLNLLHDLESETPNGAWFTTIRAANPAQVPIRTMAPR